MSTTAELRSKAEAVEYPSELYIDGEFSPAADGATLEPIDPSTEAPRGAVAAAGEADIDRAVAAARRAFESPHWARVHPRERKAAIMRLADLIDAHTEQLAALITMDMGKPIGDSIGEVGASANHFRFFAEAVDKVYGEVTDLGEGALAYITREPIGVVGTVTPWNYPLMMLAWKLGPALAAGNCVVVKPAEEGTTTAQYFAKLVAEADFPRGVVNVVPGRGEIAGKRLGLHEDVDKIAFTGSTEIGKMFMQYAGASNLKSVSLECGGKSPTVVLGDAPGLQQIAEQVARGFCENTGQVCNAGTRLIVDSKVRDELLDAVVNEVNSNWRPGDPFEEGVTMGPLVSKAQYERVKGYIEIAREEQGEFALGGELPGDDQKGYYVEPTIVTGVTNETRIAREEIFGPVLTVLEYSTEEEALKIADDTPYGLAAGIWTRDVSKAHKLARRLRAGSVYVNCWDYGDVTLPFGGFRASGVSRDKSLHALANYTELKSTYVNLDL